MFHRAWTRALPLLESDMRRPVDGAVGRGPSTSVIIVPCLLLLPLPLSGAVRYVTALSMWWCLWIAALCAGLLLAVWWPLRDRRARSRHLWLAGGLWLAVVGVTSLGALYDPNVYGVPTSGGIDSVGHIMEMQALVGRDPHAYFGMTAFQATAYWLQELGLDPFRAFRAVIYALFLATLAYSALVQGALAADLEHSRSSRWPVWLLAGLSLALGYYPAVAYLLPMLHGYQAEGYFPQLHGLVPLFATALLYGVARRRLVRMLCMPLGILLLRFTYFLNIVDLIVTCALMVAWEAVAAESDLLRRRVLGGLAVLGLALSGYLYTQLYAIADTAGGIPAPDMTWRVLGTGGLSALLLCFPLVSERLVLHRPAPKVARLAVFVGAYGVVGTVVQCVWAAGVYSRGYAGDDVYLLHKYGFSACVLGIATAVPYLAYVVTVLLSSASGALMRLRVPGVAAATTLVVVSTICHALSVPPEYSETFRSRVGEMPSSSIALADLAAWSLIRSVLRVNECAFGSFLTPRAVETYFAGYALRPIRSPDRLPPLDGETGLPPTLDYPLVDIIEPQRCVFWLEPKVFLHERSADPVDVRRHRAVKSLHGDAKVCQAYERRSYPGGPVELCHTCFEGSVQRLSVTAAQHASGSADGERPAGSTTTEATIRLTSQLRGRFSLRLSAGGQDYSVTFNGRQLQHVSPGRLPIPADLLVNRTEHAITIQSAGAGSAADFAVAGVGEVSVICVHKVAAAIDRKSREEHERGW